MELRARIGTVTTSEPFVIARGTEEVNEVLWVELRQDGVVGRGEAAPIPRYDESAQSALAYAEAAGPELGTWHIVEGANHQYTGREAVLTDLVESWLRTVA